MNYIYILTTPQNTALYIGVTNSLHRRIYEHKNKLVDGFTKKYNVTKLVYYETTSSITDAIKREKQLKRWSRIKKEQLINSINPEWNDLYIE